MPRLAALALIACLALACAAPLPPPASHIPASPSVSSSLPPASASNDPRVVGWRADIGQLVDQLEARHPDLDEQVSLVDLQSRANDLSSRVPTLTDDRLLDGIMGIVALVSRKGCDAHTGAYVWGGGSYPVDSLPLRLWLFGSDVYVVDALPPFQDLIGQLVRAVGGRPTDEVVQLLEPLVPRDNDETVRLLMPRFLLIPQVLRGVGLSIGSTVTLQTQNAGGTTTSTDVPPIPMAGYNDWAGAYGLHLPANSNMLYLSRMNDRLWWQRLDDGSLYVQYNEMESAAFADLEAALADPSVQSVVLDLRNNFGGEVYILDHVTSIFQDWLAAAHNHRLEIATARNTFSAGSLFVARFAGRPQVEISGEPMGGCPTGWGNNRDFNLRYSSIPISVSTTFEVGASADDQRPTIEPDLAELLTITDWLHNSDPVVEAHLVHGQ